MSGENWNVTDEQVLIKTGKKIVDWCRILDRSNAADKKPNDLVAFLQTDHGVQRHWARILTTNYLLNHNDSPAQ
jgi:hypothetical protein